MKTENLNEKRIASLEKKLAAICQEIYELNVGGRRFVPNYPYCLTRVLPKEHMTEGGIILAETAQDKPVYEGIVIAVWKPYTERRVIIDSQGGKSDETIYRRSSFEVGTRIAFAHFEGISTGAYLDDKYYRLVREEVNQKDLPYCGILGTIDYTGDAEVSRKIRTLTNKIGSVTTSGAVMSRGATPSEVAR
jgi:co-chaperonin GroES (HSP10)